MLWRKTLGDNNNNKTTVTSWTRKLWLVYTRFMKTWHGILQSKNIKTNYDSRILGHPQHQNVLQKNEIISYYTHGIFFDINCYHLKSSKNKCPECSWVLAIRRKAKFNSFHFWYWFVAFKLPWKLQHELLSVVFRQNVFHDYWFTGI